MTACLNYLAVLELFMPTLFWLIFRWFLEFDTVW